MKRQTTLIVAVCGAIAAVAAHGAVNVDFGYTIRPMKPEHGIGQSPMLGINVKKMFHYLTEAGIPYSRLHDVGGWLSMVGSGSF